MDALVYVIARDFGFAPNPFHGFCTLATCMERMRPYTKIGDWVFGMGGTRLKAQGRCIFAMEVTKIVTFDQYWSAPEFRAKRPKRNGSAVMVAGDNIYHRATNGEWQQEDSHHSRPDGTKDDFNTEKDTSADAVLISDKFWYFGKDAKVVPPEILTDIGYKNRRHYRRIPGQKAEPLISWVRSFQQNRIYADPFDFGRVGKRFSWKDGKIL